VPVPESAPIAGSNSSGTSAQSLELDQELDAWISSLYAEKSSSQLGKHPITMLNLLSFFPGKKSSYLQYGASFGASVGKKFGGNAKIVRKRGGMKLLSRSTQVWRISGLC